MAVAEPTTKPSMPAIHWMSSVETAEYLGVHINHLRTIPPSRLPYYNIAGRNRRYQLKDIEAFIEASRVDGSDAPA